MRDVDVYAARRGCRRSVYRRKEKLGKKSRPTKRTRLWTVGVYQGCTYVFGPVRQENAAGDMVWKYNPLDNTMCHAVSYVHLRLSMPWSLAVSFKVSSRGSITTEMRGECDQYVGEQYSDNRAGSSLIQRTLYQMRTRMPQWITSPLSQ